MFDRRSIPLGRCEPDRLLVDQKRHATPSAARRVAGAGWVTTKVPAGYVPCSSNWSPSMTNMCSCRRARARRRAHLARSAAAPPRALHESLRTTSARSRRHRRRSGDQSGTFHSHRSAGYRFVSKRADPDLWTYEPVQNAIWQTFGGYVTIKDERTSLRGGFTTGDYRLRYYLLNGEPFFKETHKDKPRSRPSRSPPSFPCNALLSRRARSSAF